MIIERLVMSKRTLFAIACEMLQTTNVFNRDITEIKYRNGCGAVSLVDIVKTKTASYSKSERDYQQAYQSIVYAMVQYIEGYPAPFSFKQRTKENFVMWLKRICEKYDALELFIPEELDNSVAEKDIGIAMLKLLHNREGISYEGLREKLGITDRAIQKNLVKISPSTYTGPKEPYGPMYLGGQPLFAEISLVSQTERAEAKRFYTPNSVHPLVLQENIMQLATLLKSLCHQYYDYEDVIGLLIAVDIWSQLSEYARKKIVDHFAFDDQDFQMFIDLLMDECPDDHACVYHTENELLREIEMTVEQAIPYLTKAAGRRGIIRFKTGVRIEIDKLLPVAMSDGYRGYEAVGLDGNIIKFNLDEVESVEIQKHHEL